MRRIALILATIGILCVGAGQVQANGYHRGHGAYYGGHHGGYYHRPAAFWVAPQVVVPAPVYRPACRPSYYPGYYPSYYGPSAGFYYQGRGVSLGIGF